MIVCTSCGEEKPITAFHLDKRWGIPRRQCKECAKARTRAAWARGYRPPAETQKRARDNWNVRHADVRSAYFKARAADPDVRRRTNDRRNAWLNSTGKGREYVHRRRSRMQGDLTAEQWRVICELYGNHCLVCGCVDVTIDHIVPISKGGENTAQNVQPLCKSCNSKKGQRIIDFRPDKCELVIPDKQEVNAST